jgi:hypothetical protein
MNKMKQKVGILITCERNFDVIVANVIYVLLMSLPRFNEGLNNFAEQSIALTTGFGNGRFLLERVF